MVQQESVSVGTLKAIANAFNAHDLDAPEFLFILEGVLVQAGRRLGPGWASVAGAGTIDDDVYSETGCIFVLVDRA
jgi:hypothetical protein